MIEKILERLEEERECSYADFEEYLMKYEIDNEFSSDDDWFYFGLKRAKTIVQEVAKDGAKDTNVLSNGWIPCSERLPEEGKMVLVYDSLHDAIDVAEFLCPHWYARYGKMDEKITAWQPLPAPYQKGE